ncbi:MAG: uracil-DNA glycosylase [Oscillospiraceae bacterium]|jgi:DNA polymerase|nr:uracil-DNA glycosylase [Oscillospiraceae bacterium]
MSTAMEKYRDACARFFADIYVGENRVLVFGEGPVHPRLMLIGEAPGEQEALAGRPFVGRAGKNLDGFLAALGLARGQLYITNAVKMRPTKVGPGGRVSNRPPTKEEIALFQPWLDKEIALVKPQALVTLGNVALAALTGRALAIGQAHGKWLPPDRHSAPLFPLYHPASVLYNPALGAAYAGDLAALAESLRTQAL